MRVLLIKRNKKKKMKFFIFIFKLNENFCKRYSRQKYKLFRAFKNSFILFFLLFFLQNRNSNYISILFVNLSLYGSLMISESNLSKIRNWYFE